MALVKKHKSSLKIDTPPSTLTSNDPVLKFDGELRSPNGLYSLTLGSKGILKVIYISNIPGGTSLKVLWASQTKNGEGKGDGYILKMQSDGNLVIYMFDRVIWNSESYGKGGQAPFRLTMQDDGNAVLYDSTNKPLWSTGTFGQK